MAGSERIDSNTEGTSTVGKILSNSNTCYREVTWEKKYPLDAANFTAVSFEEIATAIPTFSNRHPDQSAANNAEAGPSTAERP